MHFPAAFLQRCPVRSRPALRSLHALDICMAKQPSTDIYYGATSIQGVLALLEEAAANVHGRYSAATAPADFMHGLT